MGGKQGTAMQAFAGQLSDADIAAVITYQRNAWSNKTGDSVQPSTLSKRNVKSSEANEYEHTSA